MDIKAGIVRVMGQDGHTTTGTGFLVHKSGLIVTCAHVIEGEPVPERVIIAFSSSGHVRSAKVLPEYWRSPKAEDVAFLQLDGPIPEGVAPLPLALSGGTSTHPFQTFGYPDSSPNDGLNGNGQIVGNVTVNGINVVQIKSTQVTTGFSGAPLLDTIKKRVVGMVTAILPPDRYGRNEETAFILPTETLQAICPLLKASEENPYKGLAAFIESDSRFFFGRQTLVEEMVDHLRNNPLFMAVVGSSGSGKSSVVMAGIFPKLRSGVVPGFENVSIISFRPRSDALASFKKSLQKSGIRIKNPWTDLPGYILQEMPGKRLVIFIDQFEELFALCEEKERSMFLEGLSGFLKGGLPLTLILTIRADFYDPLILSPLGTLLKTGQINVQPMSESEMRLAIERPADEVGIEIEAGLEDRILDDLRVIRQPLPLLEMALYQLWERRSPEGVMTNQAYSQIGGAAGSVSRWATEMFNQLSPEEKFLSQRIFTRLIHYGQGDVPDTRVRKSFVDLSAGSSEAEIHQVIKKLADARLLITDRQPESGVETAEIVHDALLREWSQLRLWISEQRGFLLWQQRLDERLREWEDKRKEEAGLLRGSNLVEAEDWLDKRGDVLNQNEVGYIKASLGLREKDERNRRRLIQGLAGIAVVFLVLFGVASWEWNEAEVQKQEAENQRQDALALYLAATAAENIRVSSASSLIGGLSLAVESLRHRETISGYNALFEAISLLPRPLKRLEHNGPVINVVFSPDGQLLATAVRDNTARIWDVKSGTDLHVLRHNGLVQSLAFSPGGQLLATASDDNTARIWDVKSGNDLHILRHNGSVQSLAFSPDGHLLATASDDNTARIWDVKSGNDLHILRHNGSVKSIAFSPDGSKVATASSDNTARIWDVDDGTELHRLIHSNSVNSIAFSHDGRMVVTASKDNTAKVWDVKSGKNRLILGSNTTDSSNTDGVKYAIFCYNDQFIATIDDPSELRVWDVASGRKIWEFSHQWDSRLWHVNSVVSSNDGLEIAAPCRDGACRIWYANNGTLHHMMIHNKSINFVAFGPGKKFVATASDDNSAIIWNIAECEVWHRFRLNGIGNSVAFSPDGEKVITGNYDNSVCIWNVSSGIKIKELLHNTTDNTTNTNYTDFISVNSVAFSPDGSKIATAGSDHKAIIWDATSYVKLKEFLHNDSVNSVAFSPDGRKIATAGSDNRAIVWDLASGVKIKELPHNGSVNSISFNQDGSKVVTSSIDTHEVTVWDVTTWNKLNIFPHEYVTSATFSHDGKKIATTGYDGYVLIWDAESGEISIKLKLSDIALSAVFNKNDSMIATGGRDNLARIWDAKSGNELLKLKHDGYVQSLDFSPDSRMLATASLDRTARIWLINKDDLINDACSRLTYNMTISEWVAFFKDVDGVENCLTCPQEGRFNESSRRCLPCIATI